MVWNIEFQVAALVIAVIVVIMCFGQKRLHFASERSFARLMFCSVLCILFDICSIFAINYINVIGSFWCKLICKTYLLFLTLVACQAAWFAVAEIRYTFHKFWIRITFAPVVVELIILALFPIGIYTDENAIYTYGVPVYTTYAMCFIYIIATFVMTVVLRNKINAKIRTAIFFWLSSWAIVAAIQFFFNNLLLVSFAIGIALIYMYCRLENPEYHLDFSTNVFNAKGFSMLMSERLKTGDGGSIVSFSLSNMSMVNDIFGSHASEQLIVEVAEFADSIHNATLFRMEDNLFSLFFEKMDDAEKAVEQLTKKFEEPWMAGGMAIELNVSVSIIEDITTFKDVDTLEEVVHYFVEESKKLVPGDVLYANEKELKMREKGVKMQNILEYALREDTIEVYFQPIYNISEGRFSSVEALARIRDVDGTIIMPTEFISFAEKNGMILRLGEVIFRKTCEFIQRMHIEQYGIEYVEVNLSAVQCMQENISRTLKNIMGEYQVAPHRINFEITETAAISSHTALKRNMQELIDYGCGFSLDDYGAGYSNLSYVVELPLKLIKLDKMLVDAYFSSEKVRIATEATISMLHQIGMQVVVEGVETEEQYLAFKRLSVEYIQGFYFSKPLPKDKLLKYIQEWL